MTNEEKAARIIARVASYGNDPRDLRDAAHEATHAFDGDVPSGQWDRETIHQAQLRVCKPWPSKLGRVKLISMEIDARAVEQLVCRDLGCSIEAEIEHWAGITFMEAIKGVGIAPPRPYGLVMLIRERMASKRVRDLADRVLALADSDTAPVPREQRARKTTRARIA